MNIKDYCKKSGRFFYYAVNNDIYAIRYDAFREDRHWTLLKNNWRVSDFNWDELYQEIKDLPDIDEYLK